MADETKKSVDEAAEIDLEMKRLDLEIKKQSLAVTKEQVSEFNEKKVEQERVRRIRVDAVRKEQEEKERRQRVCKHKTGGKGKQGFLHGDGAHGYCVAQSALPTGELYMICTRCQREWHHPTWIVKREVYDTGKTTMTKSRYDRMLAEYNEALGWDHPYTEITESARFKVPMLDMIDINKIPLAKEEVNA